MPLYEYECDACGQRFEVIQKFSDPAPDACRKCGKGPVQRLMSSPAIQFKGSGLVHHRLRAEGQGRVRQGPSLTRAQTASSNDGKAAEGGAKSESAAKTDTSSKADTPATSSPAPSTAKE